MPLPPLSLKLLILVQFLTGASLALALGWAYNRDFGWSFAVGAALMIFSVLFYAWTGKRAEAHVLNPAKKSIAWTSLLIVFKYAVLLESIFLLTQTSWFSLLGAGLGVASFTLAALIYVVLFSY